MIFNTMKQIAKPNILFLPKIKKEDFISIDDIFENRILETIDDPITPELLVPFDKIPPRFYNLANWIKTTNLKCWNCCRNFSGLPLFLPSRIMLDDTNTEYLEVKGNFCTINCAYTYSLCRYKESEVIDIYSKLLLLYEKIYGVKILKIPLSPPKEELKEFGGDLTSEEYEKEITKKNKEQNLTKYKLEHFSDINDGINHH